MPFKLRPGSKIWWISYTDGSGKRIKESAGTADKRQAQSFETHRRDAIRRLTKLGQPLDRTFDEVLAAYLKASTTKRSHARDLTSARHLAGYFTGHTIGTLNASHITGYKQHRTTFINRHGQHRPPSEATVAKELLLLSRAIRHCNTHHDWRLPNPTTHRTGKTTDPHRLPRWLTPAEAQTLIQAAQRSVRSPYIADFIQLSLATGMRKSEVLTLEWSRVDTERRLIWFQSGTGTKSGRAEAVPLNDTALCALTRRRAWNAAHGLQASPYVFASPKPNKTGQPQPITSVKTVWRHLIKTTGLTGVKPHTLRHTFCSWMVQAGTDLRKVSSLMRHTDIRTTMLYAHLAPKTGQETAAIDQVFAQPSPHLVNIPKSKPPTPT